MTVSNSIAGVYDQSDIFTSDYLFLPLNLDLNLESSAQTARLGYHESRQDSWANLHPSDAILHHAPPFARQKNATENSGRYKCHVCNYSCIKSSDMQKHQVKHQRPPEHDCFKCRNEPCARSFPRRDNRNRHSRQHCPFRARQLP